MMDQEMEVKFYLNNLATLQRKLRNQEASLVQPRVHEINLRFDLPSGELARDHRILRLRQDAGAVLTYKGPAENRQDVSSRQEIEVEVNDFAMARRLLEALGYQVYIIYEKYRATYLMDNVRVTLDEMPYGDFAEVEGPDPASIQATAEKLGLEWSKRIMESYLMMFAGLPAELKAGKRDLTFANFQAVTIKPGDLGVTPAD